MGAQTAPPPASQRRLVLPRTGRLIAGVCQGIAVTYGWDPTWVRVIFVLLACLSGVGLVLYVVLWVVAPSDKQRIADHFHVHGPSFPDFGPSWNLQNDGGPHIPYCRPTDLNNYVKWGGKWPDAALIQN
jgi:phage shock protein PspC (stress-responsive transcriptional regulator)